MTENANNMYESESSAREENESRTLKEIIYDVTEQELSGFRDDTVAADKLKMMAQKQTSRLRRRNRLIGAAAVIFVALAGVLFAVGDFFENVEADKNAREEIVTEDGVVIEDGGWGSSREDKLVISDWDEVILLGKKVDEIIIPQYVPDRFSFKTLYVESVENDYITCEFTFSSSIDDIEIHECIMSNMMESFVADEVDYVINCNFGEAYIHDAGGNKKATVQVDDSTLINIWGVLDDKEIQMIVNNLSN